MQICWPMLSLSVLDSTILISLSACVLAGEVDSSQEQGPGQRELSKQSARGRRDVLRGRRDVLGPHVERRNDAHEALLDEVSRLIFLHNHAYVQVEVCICDSFVSVRNCPCARDRGAIRHVLRGSTP